MRSNPCDAMTYVVVSFSLVALHGEDDAQNQTPEDRSVGHAHLLHGAGQRPAVPLPRRRRCWWTLHSCMRWWRRQFGKQSPWLDTRGPWLLLSRPFSPPHSPSHPSPRFTCCRCTSNIVQRDRLRYVAARRHSTASSGARPVSPSPADCSGPIGGAGAPETRPSVRVATQRRCPSRW